MNQDYYKTLGVDRNADADEIRKAYRRLARKHHPDLNPGDKSAEEHFKKVQEAYDVLSEPKKKQMYDQHGFYSENGMPGAGAGGGAGPHMGFGGFDFSDLFTRGGAAGARGRGGSDAVDGAAAAAGTAARPGRALRRRLRGSQATRPGPVAARDRRDGQRTHGTGHASGATRPSREFLLPPLTPRARSASRCMPGSAQREGADSWQTAAVRTHGMRFDVNRPILVTELPPLRRPAAKAAGFDAVEFWWPFRGPVPSGRAGRVGLEYLLADPEDSAASPGWVWRS